MGSERCDWQIGQGRVIRVLSAKIGLLAFDNIEPSRDNAAAMEHFQAALRGRHQCYDGHASQVQS